MPDCAIPVEAERARNKIIEETDLESDINSASSAEGPSTGTHSSVPFKQLPAM
jgi:hypothetical protein